MLSRLSAVTARLALSSLLVMMLALPALAQEAEVGSEAPRTNAWMAVVMAVVFGIGISIGCFTTPRRTHLD